MRVKKARGLTRFDRARNAGHDSSRSGLESDASLTAVDASLLDAPPPLFDRITPTAVLPDISAIAGPSPVASLRTVVVHPVPG